MPDFNILNIFKKCPVNNEFPNRTKISPDVKTEDSIMNKYNTYNNDIDIERLEQDYADAESKVSDLTEENEIQTNIDSIQETKDTLSENIEQKTTNISELTKQISVKNQALSGLTYPDKVQFAKREVDKDGNEKITYPGFDEACREIDRQKQKIQDEITELESKINTENKELNDLQSNFDKAESQINSLKQDKNNIQNDGEIEQAQSEADTAKAKLDEGRTKQAQEEQINSTGIEDVNEISEAGAVSNNKNLEDDKKEENQKQSENSVIFEGSIADNPPTVYSTKFINNIHRNNDSVTKEQYESLKKYDNNQNTVFDVYENGTVIVTFPDGRNAIKVDSEGNETEIATEVNERKSGRKSVSYTLADEYGNSYTRDNRFDEEGNFTNSITHLNNKDGQEIRRETYDKGFNLSQTEEYEYDENGNLNKETVTNYKENKAKSIEEKFFDENGNLNSSTILNYDSERNVKSTQETQYEYDENGKQSRQVSVTYGKNGEIKSTQETQYEYDENGNKRKTTVSTYDKNGEIKSTKETQFENGNKRKTTVSTYDKNGEIKSTEEQLFENGQKVKIIETIFNSKDRSQVINEYNSFRQLTNRTFIKKDEKTGNTIKLSSEFDNNNITNWSQEVLNDKGEVISELNNEKLISELNKKGINISEEEALKMGNFADELTLDDMIYAFENGYDKFLDNIADYGGIEHIKDGSATSFITNDYNKLIDAIKNKESVEETFCPTMDSEEKAQQDLNVGDTCVIDGKLYIKTEEGMEQLNMSREKYLELFPPSARFSINQQESGDCYLLSALYSMETNPNTYANILRCFTENEDGSVTVKIPYKNINEKYNNPDLPFSERLENMKKDDYYVISDVTLTIPANGKMDDFYTPNTNYKGESGPTYANACEGIRALEYLYGFCSINENIDNIFNELDAAIESGNQDEIDRLNERIIEVTNKAELAKGSGGDCSLVFLDFGLNSPSTGPNTPDNENNVYCASTSANGDLSTLSSIGEADRHAYAVRPFYNEDGELMYEVVNPLHTSYSSIVTPEELKDTFDTIYIGEP